MCKVCKLARGNFRTRASSNNHMPFRSLDTAVAGLAFVLACTPFESVDEPEAKRASPSDFAVMSETGEPGEPGAAEQEAAPTRVSAAAQETETPLTSLRDDPLFPRCDDARPLELVGDGELVYRRACAPSLSAKFPFFSDTVLLQLPSGLGDELLEMNPTLARTTREHEHPGCVDGVGGPLITVAFLGVFELDKDPKPLEAAANDMIDALGYPPGTTRERVRRRENAIDMVLSAPEHRGRPAAKSWMTVAADGDRGVFIVYESHPNAWNALARTFACSAQSLQLLPSL